MLGFYRLRCVVRATPLLYTKYRRFVPTRFINNNNTANGDTNNKDNQENGQVSNYLLPHPIWSQKEQQSVQIAHVPPKSFVDKYAYVSVWLLRLGFDIFSGYYFGNMTETKWIRRIIFLETLAGVPGMMAAMARHLQSLRTMNRDRGWIHTLLEEAENERMHLLVALELRQPGILLRYMVLIAQGVFVNLFFVSYLISPHYCHRFVGYLEEEAVITYTKILKEIEEGSIKHWQTQEAPQIAKKYWRLPENATMKDVILVIRADEAHHRTVNHRLSDLRPDDENPYGPGR